MWKENLLLKHKQSAKLISALADCPNYEPQMHRKRR